MRIAGERLDQVASDTDILGMMCDQCALERGLATGQPGEATATGAVECVTVGCFPDLAPMRPRGARAMLAAPSENTWRRANDGAAVNRYATGIWRRMAASAVVGVLVLSGCGGGSADKAGETAGGAVTASDATAGRTLRVAAGSEFAAQDPHDYAGDFILLDMVFEPLVRYGEDGVLKPALATAWRVSKDGLTVHSICVRT